MGTIRPLLVAAVLGRPAARADDRAVLFADDFENRTALGKEYTYNPDRSDSFQVTNGILVIRQLNPDHGAVLRKDIAFKNLDLEFDFRFSGGKSFNVVINDKQDKTVWSGHVCRVSVTPK